MRLGGTLRGLRRYSEALAQYRAVEERTDLAADWRSAARMGIAHCYFSLERFDESAAWDRVVLEADPDRPRTGLRPDFHLRGTPPIQSCAIRLNLCDALARGGKIEEADLEARRVARECPAVGRLLAEAERRIRKFGARRATR